jgi:hypothetical protein
MGVVGEGVGVKVGLVKVGLLTGVEVGYGLGLAVMVGDTEFSWAVNVIATTVLMALRKTCELAAGPQALSKKAVSNMKTGRIFFEVYIHPGDSIRRVDIVYDNEPL